jgi:hypothetical protein
MKIAREIQDNDDEKIDRSADEIKARALALGFRLKPQGADDDDDEEGVAFYVLTDISTGDRPLGPDPVPAAEIEKFLDNHADDLGDDAVDEIDKNKHLKKVRPPKDANKQAARIVKAGKSQVCDDKSDQLAIEKIKQHNARVLADRQFNRTNLTTSVADPESDEDHDPDERDVGVHPTGTPLPPEPGEYNPTPKAAVGFAVVSKTGRLSSAEMAKRKMLLGCTTELRAALAEKPRDPIKIGRYLHSAKELVGHGGFEKWVSNELLLPARTAQSYIMAYKKAQL